jgi:hypothetical protein
MLGVKDVAAAVAADMAKRERERERCRTERYHDVAAGSVCSSRV